MLGGFWLQEENQRLKGMEATLVEQAADIKKKIKLLEDQNMTLQVKSAWECIFIFVSERESIVIIVGFW